MRSSAAATGTLNIYGCKNSTWHGATAGVADQGGTAGAAPWDLRASCSVSAGDATPHNQHFGDSTNYVKTYQVPGNSYVWYWDGDVTLEGEFCSNAVCTPTGHSTELQGSVVVRGNLSIDTPGDFQYTGHVPTNAWKEENKLTQSTFDSAASAEYPADTGLHQNSATWNFGTSSFCQPLSGSCSWVATVGVRGFVYTGGNLNIYQFMDFHGAVWVNGAVNATGGDATHFCGIYYDDTLQVPTLNVILQRLSWQEVAASNTAWP